MLCSSGAFEEALQQARENLADAAIFDALINIQRAREGDNPVTPLPIVGVSLAPPASPAFLPISSINFARCQTYLKPARWKVLTTPFPASAFSRLETPRQWKARMLLADGGARSFGAKKVPFAQLSLIRGPDGVLRGTTARLGCPGTARAAAPAGPQCPRARSSSNSFSKNCMTLRRSAPRSNR